jgi:hypothetical protein
VARDDAGGAKRNIAPSQTARKTPEAIRTLRWADGGRPLRPTPMNRRPQIAEAMMTWLATTIVVMAAGMTGIIAELLFASS